MHGHYSLPCANPESFVRAGPTLTTFYLFLVDEGREDPNTIISGPSMTFRWPIIECWLRSFAIFRGSEPVLLRNSIFCDSSGEIFF